MSPTAHKKLKFDPLVSDDIFVNERNPVIEPAAAVLGTSVGEIIKTLDFNLNHAANMIENNALLINKENEIQLSSATKVHGLSCHVTEPDNIDNVRFALKFNLNKVVYNYIFDCVWNLYLIFIFLSTSEII